VDSVGASGGAAGAEEFAALDGQCGRDDRGHLAGILAHWKWESTSKTFSECPISHNEANQFLNRLNEIQTHKHGRGARPPRLSVTRKKGDLVRG